MISFSSISFQPLFFKSRFFLSSLQLYFLSSFSSFFYLFSSSSSSSSSSSFSSSSSLLSLSFIRISCHNDEGPVPTLAKTTSSPSPSWSSSSKLTAQYPGHYFAPFNGTQQQLLCTFPYRHILGPSVKMSSSMLDHTAGLARFRPGSKSDTSNE